MAIGLVRLTNFINVFLFEVDCSKSARNQEPSSRGALNSASLRLTRGSVGSGDRAKRCLSEDPAPRAFSARAEDKLKLSDDVIEDEFTSTFNSRPLYLSLSSLERLNRRFKFDKRRQLFIRSHNETLFIRGSAYGSRTRVPALRGLCPNH